MRLLVRALIILGVGAAVSLLFLQMGNTSWADQIRNRRGGRRPPAALNAPTGERSAGLTPDSPTVPEGGSGIRAPAPGGGRGPQGFGARGGRGGSPGLFTHYSGPQTLRGNFMRYAQILVLQIGVPLAVTLALLALTRRRRRSMSADPGAQGP